MEHNEELQKLIEEAKNSPDIPSVFDESKIAKLSGDPGGPGFRQFFSYEPKAKTLTNYANECHEANKKWWTHLDTGEYPMQRNTGELLMLCVSELAEAMEGHRKGLKDDKLPHRDMIDVELVDCFIRIADLMGARNIDFETIYQEKMAYNAQRADHKPENRKLAGGKKY